MMPRRTVILFWQLLILAALLAVWQWGFEWSRAVLPKAYVPSILDPYFIAKPTMIWESFLRLGCLNIRTASSPACNATTTICGLPRW
jgi:NitT/TauT family transport system permease protein